MNKINNKLMTPITVFDDEELSSLRLIVKTRDTVNQIIDNINFLAENTVQQGGDFTGSWQGIDKPHYAEEGQGELLERHEEEINQLKQNLSIVSIPVSNFGAIGDGITDDTQAIQKGLDLATLINVKLVFNGEYLLTDTLNVYSNTCLEGINNTTFKMQGNKPSMRLIGEVVGTTTLIENTTDRQNYIKVSNTTGIKQGEYIILNSQRSTFGLDSGEFYRLGTTTENTATSYFGEFAQVESTVLDTINFYSSLYFPFYKKDKVGESDTLARNGTIIERVKFIENVNINNIKFESKDLTNENSIIQCEFTLNCEINNCVGSLGNEGSFISIGNSFNTNGLYNRVFYSKNTPSSIYAQNCYKILSSQNCDFIGCEVNGGSQPIDITYIGLRMPSINCSIEGCKVENSLQTGITLHPSTYKCNIINNVVNSSKDGIQLRGQGHNCSNNSVTGKGVVDSYGIGFTEGYANDINCTNNVVDSFAFSFRVHEQNSSRDLSYNKSLRLNINNNKITRVRIPLYIDRVATSTQLIVEGVISFKGNLISNFKPIGNTTVHALYVSGNSTIRINSISYCDNMIYVKGENEFDITNLIRIESNSNFEFSRNNVIGLDNTDNIVYGTTSGRKLVLDYKHNNYNGTTPNLSTTTGLTHITINE